ncbi:EAL domain-containing protein [Candidatus Tisiphia endosymbiont of Nemotelus uliginosus]|uniref:EAL domain-containing protein n=1 Tax=Candidatus Tisiphia endosymbiont of Nemotelus uliginosus TaxID=3077926 RepID=UPI0035C8A8AE
MSESEDSINAAAISKLQLKIDEMQIGYCVAFKLLNYDELNSIVNSNIKIIKVLDKIIKEVCGELITLDESGQYFQAISTRNIDSYLAVLPLLHNDTPTKPKVKIPIYQQIEVDRIFVVLPIKDQKLVREIALKIYLLSQLYVTNSHAALYMNCGIASIEFPKITSNAQEIYVLLNWLLTYQGDQLYYREYDNKQYNIEYVHKANKQLNLLRKALLNKNMVFAYQPVIDRKTMNVSYYECLLRIPDAQNNLISVGSLTQEAEKKGLIFIIDQIVLEMAVKELAANKDLKLAVNISNIGILDPPLLVIAEKLLQAYDVADRLIIEITETTFNNNYEQITSFMLKLRKFGCKFALDDFGSGFTSFAQLQNLPIDIIKIDGSYVRKITSDAQSQDFIARLVKISEAVGAITVAEFVENGEIAQSLIDLKVDSMQGDFFAPALTNKTKD